MGRLSNTLGLDLDGIEALLEDAGIRTIMNKTEKLLKILTVICGHPSNTEQGQLGSSWPKLDVLVITRKNEWLRPGKDEIKPEDVKAFTIRRAYSDKKWDFAADELKSVSVNLDRDIPRIQIGRRRIPL